MRSAAGRPIAWGLACMAMGLLALVAAEPTAAKRAPAEAVRADGGTAEPDPGTESGPPGAFGSDFWIDDAALGQTGFGRVRFRTLAGAELFAEVYRATEFDPKQGPIWFVMHGVRRDADRYILRAAPVAERHDALAVAVCFTERFYPKSEDYTLGVWSRGSWKEPDKTPYGELERVFDGIRRSLEGVQAGYHIFGHSAGAQFTHRLLTFLPQPRALRAVAANAGWYTLPVTSGKPEHDMPYGLNDAPLKANRLVNLFRTELTVLLGEQDTTTAATDPLVRGTPEAQAQGAHRLARGLNYHRVAQGKATTLGVPLAWRLAQVPGVGHDAARMLPSAAPFLFEQVELLPPADNGATARGLVLHEILADPPSGSAGDANGDGTRDPLQDEFVEFLNAGDKPVSLDGWTLGDADKPDRHIFPLGSVIPPGGVLVVFGGGIPTGDFQEARVQWARNSLSLSNSGDVLTLRDATGRVAGQWSWGDCAGQPQAADHHPQALDFNSSLTRNGRPSGRWLRHDTVYPAPFSPGLVRRQPSSR